jgi:hypothetical protein
MLMLRQPEPISGTHRLPATGWRLAESRVNAKVEIYVRKRVLFATSVGTDSHNSQDSPIFFENSEYLLENGPLSFEMLTMIHVGLVSCVIRGSSLLSVSFESALWPPPDPGFHPCHIEPDMRFVLIRLSDNLLPVAFAVSSSLSHARPGAVDACYVASW